MNAGDVYSIPLEDIDVSRPELFRDNLFGSYFERLRNEDPVHYCRQSRIGPYWSVTRYADVIEVETHPEVFSSDIHQGGFNIQDVRPDRRRESFMAMDDPGHALQRKGVMPMFRQEKLVELGQAIRMRSASCLDELPRGEVFDWVDRVSIELTTQMLAVLFDFPWEERRQLTRWSDVATAAPGNRAIISSEVAREAELQECGAYFMKLWNERRNEPPRDNLLSMMAHAEGSREMTPQNLLGNILVLLVGGNDTTRNTMSGSLYALNKFPDEYRKLRATPGLIDSFVQEVIRWQTPIAHMRRTALHDYELAGKQIRKGDRVVMWYASANRDERAISQPERFDIERERVRHHLSFGFGVHRCIGLRLAELQLRVLWQELLTRFESIELAGEPTRTLSNFVLGYESMPARISG